MLQIDFFDEDLLHTLVPIHTLKPNAVCFVADKRTITDKRLALAEKTLHCWNPAVKIACIDVNPDNLEEIKRALEGVLSARPKEETVYIDLTGGTELMVIAGYELCSKHGAIPVYMDSTRNHLLDARSGEYLMPVDHISVNDYITAIGAKSLPHSHPLPTAADAPSICRVAECFFKYQTRWRVLHQYISQHMPKSQVLQLPDKFLRNHKLFRLVNTLLQEGFLITDGASRYRYRDEAIHSYLITYGIWLELYIYVKAREFFDESSLGLVVDWDGTDSIDRVDNEFDVIAMHRSMPLFISCKMCPPTTDDIYEIASLASRMGGVAAKACIATTEPLHKAAYHPNSMFNRIDKMHVGLIEAADFQTQTPEEIFRKVLKVTEETGVP